MNSRAPGLDVDVTLDRGHGFRLDVQLEVPAGVSVVCGPSGSGKSSLLLTILGALRPDRGRIRLGATTLFDNRAGRDLPVPRRRVGMVFQDAPLFPHLDVLRNAAFGLRRGRRHDAEELLHRVGAAELARRWPHELSGGQRQRVALARALAPRPAALLLDEPFSALDPASRSELGTLLLELQAASGIPFLHVTHDLGEALRLGERLVLLDAGRVVECGPPLQVLATPSSIPAARAVGIENVFRGTIRGHDPQSGCSEVDLGGTCVQTALLDETPGTTLALGLRAEDVLLSLRAIADTSARNVLPARIVALESRGVAVEIVAGSPVAFRVRVTPGAVRQLGLAVGRSVFLLIKASAFHRLR